MTKPMHELREQICEICRWSHTRGWLSASDGNVSVRLGRDRLLATPSGLHKGFLRPSDLVVCDMQGRRVSGAHPVTSEMAMHIAAYEARPDINAVVHMHPTYAIAFSVAGETLAQCLLPEVVFTFGIIPTAPYSAPTTDEVPESIRRYITDFDAMILERHGSLTVGRDVMDAYMKLERMEHVAQITHAAKQLGEVKPLTPQQIQQLQEIGEGLGLPRRKVQLACDQCNACPNGRLGLCGIPPAPFPVSPPASPPRPAPSPVTASTLPRVDERVMQIIVEEVGRAMAGGRN